jgi:hypothetical protein
VDHDTAQRSAYAVLERRPGWIRSKASGLQTTSPADRPGTRRAWLRPLLEHSQDKEVTGMISFQDAVQIASPQADGHTLEPRACAGGQSSPRTQG